MNQLHGFRLISCHDSRAKVDRLQRRLEQSGIRCVLEQIELTTDGQTVVGYRLYVDSASVAEALAVIEEVNKGPHSRFYGSRSEPTMTNETGRPIH